MEPRRALILALALAGVAHAQPCAPLRRALAPLCAGCDDASLAASMSDPQQTYAVLRTHDAGVRALRPADQPLIYWEARTRIALDETLVFADRDPRQDEVLEHARAWAQVAQARRDRGQLERATLAWATAERDAGELDAALAHAQVVIERAPPGATGDTLALAWALSALELEERGEPASARERLRRALEAGARSDGADPAAPWTGCEEPAGRERWAARRRGWELDALRLARRDDPDPAATSLALRTLAERDTAWAPARAAAVRLVAAAAAGHAARGRHDAAEALLGRALALDPADLAAAELHVRLGAVRAAAGDVRGALASFRDGFELTGRQLAGAAHRPRRAARLAEMLREHESLFFSRLRAHRGREDVVALALALQHQRRGREGLLRGGGGERFEDLETVRAWLRPGGACGPPRTGRLRACLAAHGIDRLVHPVTYTDAGVERAALLSIDAHAPPRWIELGPRAPIDHALAELVRRVSSPGSAYRPAALRFTRRVLDGDARVDEPRVAVVADRFLRQVPFLALEDTRGPWLGRVDVTVLPSLRALEPDPTPASGSAAELFGDPALGPRDAAVAVRRELRAGRGWARLPGTRAEVRRIAPLLVAAELHLGRDATEQALREVSGGGSSPSVLHLATHGSGARVRGTLEQPSSGHGFLVLTPELLRGAAISQDAGARADGIVASEDIRALSLTETSLVVLSACESGAVPDTRIGVDGLRRAFLAAGAHAVVSSLWTVDDAATRDLMVAYYLALARGEDRHRALSIAAAQVQRTRPHPHYWAAFQVVGAPGPVCIGPTGCGMNR